MAQRIINGKQKPQKYAEIYLQRTNTDENGQQKKSVKSDAIKKSVKSDAIKKSVKSDAIKKSVKSDA
jgi:hypothetical protein